MTAVWGFEVKLLKLVKEWWADPVWRYSDGWPNIDNLIRMGKFSSVSKVFRRFFFADRASTSFNMKNKNIWIWNSCKHSKHQKTQENIRENIRICYIYNIINNIINIYWHVGNLPWICVSLPLYKLTTPPFCSHRRITMYEKKNADPRKCKKMLLFNSRTMSV